jgi:hypothetical protein
MRGRGRGRAVSGWLRTAGSAGVPSGCVAVAQGRRPDVAERKEDSGGGAGGGRGNKVTCGRGESGAGLHGGGLRSSDGEVRCTGGREHSGRWRAAWRGEGKPARGR